MKRFIQYLLPLSLISAASAETFTSRIHSIERGMGNESHLIKFENGRVAFIDSDRTRQLRIAEDNLRKQNHVKLEVDASSSMKSLEETTVPSRDILPDPPTNPSPAPRNPYVPSVVSSTRAHNMFIRMRRDYKDKSQCFNRAQVWTYEEFKKYKTNLNKVFMFFTSSYIRAYRYHWWFHVTPMTYVGGTKYANWKMLDRRYTSGPLSPKTWSDVFIKSKRSCKVVTKYSDYKYNQRSQHCYFMNMPMHYLVPSDIERIERSGEEKHEYDMLEVEYAYWEAFGRDMPQ